MKEEEEEEAVDGASGRSRATATGFPGEPKPVVPAGKRVFLGDGVAVFLEKSVNERVRLELKPSRAEPSRAFSHPYYELDTCQRFTRFHNLALKKLLFAPSQSLKVVSFFCITNSKFIDRSLTSLIIIFFGICYSLV